MCIRDRPLAELRSSTTHWPPAVIWMRAWRRDTEALSMTMSMSSPRPMLTPSDCTLYALMGVRSATSVNVGMGARSFGCGAVLAHGRTVPGPFRGHGMRASEGPPHDRARDD